LTLIQHFTHTSRGSFTIMRSIFLLLILIALLPLTAVAQSGDYEITQVDPATNTFTGKLNAQMRTFRVRPGVEVTINGVKVTFADLEPGLTAKITSAEPGIATKVVAFGIRTRQAKTTSPSPLGGATQSSRTEKVKIAANSPDGFPIGDVRKGTRISIRYLGGKWKHHGRIAQFSPDGIDPLMVDKDRLAVALPAADGKHGEVLAIIPSGTAKEPFVFLAEQDYPGLVLRIQIGRSPNPGSVEYEVKVLPPAR
jgi:hypothetical protein